VDNGDCCVVMIGAALKAMFDALIAKVRKVTRTRHGKSEDPVLTIKKFDAKKMEWVSQSLLAHGIARGFHENFVPRTIRDCG